MGRKYIISIDLGTTGNRVFCFDETGHPISSSYKEFTQYFPQPGHVEHDPVEIWNCVKELIPDAIKKGNLSPADAISIGITNQRETTVLWDRENGKPVYNAIVWQCRRTTDICNQLKAKKYDIVFRKRTGLVIDAYFSGTKIKWLLDNVAGARELAGKKRLLFGTIDTWILWNLTGGVSHKTDYTNASRTLVFNINEKKWDGELLETLDIPDSILPVVQDSASGFGVTKNVPGLPDGITIGGIAGDQQAAMVGQGCVKEGSIKNTYGTGCFMLLNTGGSNTISEYGLLTTLVCDNLGKPVYAFEGSTFIAGAVIQWLRDYMKFFEKSAASESMAAAAGRGDEVVFVPAFVGLGSPYWKSDARGAVFGLTRDTSREQITRAALKSIAMQTFDIIEAMQQDSGKVIHELRVDGGATGNEYLMQFQADILDIPVLLPEVTESTALGAAYLAGLTAGLWGSIEEISMRNKITRRFEPKMSEDERLFQKKIWKDAIKRILL